MVFGRIGRKAGNRVKSERNKLRHSVKGIWLRHNEEVGQSTEYRGLGQGVQEDRDHAGKRCVGI